MFTTNVSYSLVCDVCGAVVEDDYAGKKVVEVVESLKSMGWTANLATRTCRCPLCKGKGRGRRATKDTLDSIYASEEKEGVLPLGKEDLGVSDSEEDTQDNVVSLPVPSVD